MSENVTQRAVLNLLSSAMFQRPFCAEKEVDWQTVFDECKAQSVVSLAFSALSVDVVPEDIYRRWKKYFSESMVLNSKISYAHTMLHQLLSRAEIPYVILKGCVSAEYYDNPLLRTMGDVDFYVPKEYLQSADRLLLKSGYQPCDEDHEYEKEYLFSGVVFELHNTVNGVPGGKTGAAVQKCFDDIFEKAELKSLDLATFCSPSPFHHGLVMLLHVARHMLTGGIGLRHFCDWAVYVDKIGDRFPALFEEKLKKVGLWRFAQIMTQFCVEYLGCPKQSWAGKPDEKLLGDLKEDIFAGGNFGHKDLKRADEAKFITSRKKGGVSNGSHLKQSILSANEIVRKHWRIAGKLPVVYPFGWLFFGVRYALRTAAGKRDKVKVKVLVAGAEKRKEIYKGLKLFEI